MCHLIKFEIHLEVDMAELKTKTNDQSVEKFLNSVPDEKKRQDSFRIKK